MSGFLRLLGESDIDQSGTISREELEKAFSKDVDYFNESQRRDLFGDFFKVQDIFDFLNHEKDDEVDVESRRSTLNYIRLIFNKNILFEACNISRLL